MNDTIQDKPVVAEMLLQLSSAYVASLGWDAGVTKEDRFIDIGSGLGTVVLQMASTTGCTATVGISSPVPVGGHPLA